jgi:hypothetical protein
VPSTRRQQLGSWLPPRLTVGHCAEQCVPVLTVRAVLPATAWPGGQDGDSPSWCMGFCPPIAGGDEEYGTAGGSVRGWRVASRRGGWMRPDPVAVLVQGCRRGLSRAGARTRPRREAGGVSRPSRFATEETMPRSVGIDSSRRWAGRLTSISFRVG